MKTRSLKVLQVLDTKRSAKQIIKQFEIDGYTHHSKNHGLLGHVIEYCEEKKIPYRITAVPGHGYIIEKFKNVNGN